MLSSYQRRFDEHGTEALRKRVGQLRVDADKAQHSYRTTMLLWGSPESDDYWLVAYSKLIEMGHTLVGKLRHATSELPVAERYSVSADVENLEAIIEDWTKRMRDSMIAAVA